MFAEQRHAQVVDRHLLGEFECAADDVVGIDGPAFASLTLIGGGVFFFLGPLPLNNFCFLGLLVVFARNHN
ncbi:hypothetical protein, partial [Mycobacterium intracellulare]|uniref:hypothetical protein n=1 Tax=Mycobacterium intracellulare TaxID=1767 RepID=UPI0019D6E769